MDRNGFCTTHMEQGTAVKISKQVWHDRKRGKGFGWVKTKSQKFIRKSKNFGYVDKKNSSSDHNKPGVKGKTLTGINEQISDS